jgi:hypothetical protein
MTMMKTMTQQSQGLSLDGRSVGLRHPFTGQHRRLGRKRRTT